MVLKDKVAIVHGAGGAIGSTVARTFAREGARLFLGGCTLAPVEAVARGADPRSSDPRIDLLSATFIGLQ